MNITRLILGLIVFVPLAYAEPEGTSPGSEFKVGLILPLTGPLAEYGVAVKNGIELAKIDHPELFNGVTYVAEDSQYDPKTAVSSFQKLATQDRVNLIYNWGGAPSEAVSPLAERHKLPLVTWSADPRTAEGRAYVFRFTNPAVEFARVLHAQLQKRGFKKIAIIKAENQYINCMLDGLQGLMGPGETLDVLDNYQISDQDFRPTVTKLKSAAYDAVGVYLISGQVSQFYRQLKQQQISISSFGTDFFESVTEIAAADGMMEGAFYANNTVRSDFGATYLKKFGNDLQITHAGNGYDFAVLAGRLFGGVKPPPGGTEIAEKLRVSGSQAGVSGTFQFQKTPAGDQHFALPIVIKYIKDGKIVELDE